MSGKEVVAEEVLADPGGYCPVLGGGDGLTPPVSGYPVLSELEGSTGPGDCRERVVFTSWI